MQVVTEEEFNKMEFIGWGYRTNKIYENLKLLKLGEALVFDRSDWPLKYAPSVGIASKFPPSSDIRFKVRTLISGEKFVALRVR